MSSSKRSLIAILTIAAVLLAMAGVMKGARLAAEGSAVEAVGDPLILSGQKPRMQDFFADEDEDAVFTISITNTGGVPLETVTVTGATTPDCSRGGLDSLAPGESTSYTCSRANVTESFLNELQVNGTTGGTTVTHRSNAFVKVLKSELQITKFPQIQTVRKGATAVFTVFLANNTNDVMMNVKVDDTLADKCDIDPSITFNLGPRETRDYSCFVSNVQTPLATVITIEGTPLLGSPITASDVGWIEILDLQATLAAQPTTIPEPGDLVTYTVELVNTGSVPTTLTGLTTDQFGNILDPGNLQVDAAQNTCLPQPSLPTLQPFGGGYTCTFVASVAGQPSDFSVNMTATAKDSNNVEVPATASATVVITNLPSSIALNLSAEPPFINPPSRLVTFNILVENTSAADSVTITELRDEFLGDLDSKGCELPAESISPGFSYQCEFLATVTGQIGQQKSRTISVTARDDDLPPQILTDSEIVSVDVTDLPAQAIYVPNVADDTVEPNNSCVRAYPLRLNREYFFRPPNQYNSSLPLDQRDQDYFSFELTASSDVVVELTNFVPQAGQLIVRDENCSNPSIDRNPEVVLNNTLDLGIQPAGRYFIQIINDGPSNIPDLYGLIVRVE